MRLGVIEAVVSMYNRRIRHQGIADAIVQSLDCRLFESIQLNYAAHRREKFGNWMALFLSLTIVIDAWLTLGPLVQGTIMTTAVLRRLRGKKSGAPGGANATGSPMEIAVKKDT